MVDSLVMMMHFLSILRFVKCYQIFLMSILEYQPLPLRPQDLLLVLLQRVTMLHIKKSLFDGRFNMKLGHSFLYVTSFIYSYYIFIILSPTYIYWLFHLYLYVGFPHKASLEYSSAKARVGRIFGPCTLDEELHILQYWSKHSGCYPIIASMACDVLCIYLTTVALESTYSSASLIITRF